MKKKRSWKTSVLGGLMIATTVFTTIASGGAAPAIISGIMAPSSLATIMAGLGLLFARDGKVVNEEED